MAGKKQPELKVYTSLNTEDDPAPYSAPEKLVQAVHQATPITTTETLEQITQEAIELVDDTNIQFKEIPSAHITLMVKEDQKAALVAAPAAAPAAPAAAPAA